MRKCVWRAWATVLATVALLACVFGAPAAALAETLDVTFEMIGPGGAAWVPETTVEVEAGTAVADLTKDQASRAGVACVVEGSGESAYFSAFSKGDSGDVGWDADTGRFWQLFVDGKSSDSGAGAVVCEDGMAVAWSYSAWGDALGEAAADTVTATISVIGPGGTVWVPATKVEVDKGVTATWLTNAWLPESGVTPVFETGSWGSYFSAFAKDGESAVAYDPETGAYWQLFVDGKNSETGADGVVFDEPHAITWAYTAADTLPTIVEVATNASVAHPVLDATWPGYLGAGWSANARTPFATGTAIWATRMSDPSDWTTYLSDPVSVGSKLWFAKGNQLLVVNQNSGTIEKTIALNASVDSACRLAYEDGYILVPLSGGSLQAVSAAAYETAWVSDAVADGAQALTPVYVSGGRAVYGTCVASWTGPATDGALTCVDVATGTVVWRRDNPRGYGYYWAGLAAAPGAEGVGVVGDDGGTLAAIDLETGAELATLELGAAVRSTPVAYAGALYVSTTDGVLHRVTVAAGGALAETGRVSFADSSTGTAAAAAGGTLVVGGAVSGDDGWHGRLAVIDAGSMRVSATFDEADGEALPGDVKSMPLVLGSHVWFTSNGQPGALYVADLETGACTAVFTPAGDQANWCMASVVPTSAGTLVYKNDSGYAFCVAAETTNDDDEAAGAAAGGAAEKNDGVAASKKDDAKATVAPAGDDATAGEAETEATDLETDDAETEDLPAIDAAVPTAYSESAEEASAGALAAWPIVAICAGLVLAGVAIAWYRRDKER